MKRPVQHEQEGHDADGHALASIFVGSNQKRLHLGKLESSKKSSNKGKKGKKCPGTNSTGRVPKKVCFEKHCNLCKKYGGVYTTHNTHDCHRFEKDGKETSDICAVMKGGKKSNPVNHTLGS